jgi:pyruvate formate lyase activating enzyme
MTGIPPTPAETLTRARQVARSAGLHHIYTGNVHDLSGGTTYCASCQHPLIVRDWYDIRDYTLDAQGNCPKCGTALAGHFEKFTGQFGRQRIPVVMSGTMEGK